MHGHTAVVKVLVEGYCNIESQDSDGWTALHTAAMYRQAETAQLLIQKGANVKARSKDNRTPLDVAAGAGHLVLVRAMDNWHALHASTEKSNISLPGAKNIVSNELKKEELALKVLRVSDCEKFALLEASSTGNVDDVSRLLLNCADVNQCDSKGLTPLHRAAANGYVTAARLLLKHNADTFATDKNGCTPLHTASMHGKADIVKLLLHYPFDLSRKDRDGWTPLHGAAKYGYFDVVKALMKHGANPKVKDNNEQTSLEMAISAGHWDCATAMASWDPTYSKNERKKQKMESQKRKFKLF